MAFSPFRLLVSLALGALLTGTARAQSASATPVPPDKQHLIDSLRTALRAAQPDTQRLNTLYELSLKWRRHSSDSALYWLKITTRLAQKTHADRQYANCLGYLGAILKDQGKITEAIGYQEQALRLHERLGNLAGQCVVHNDLGMLHKSLKQWEPALIDFHQARALAEQLIDRPQPPAKFMAGLAYTFNNIGTVYMEQGQYAQALPWYQKSLVQARRAQNRDAEATALTNLAGLEAEMKQFSAAAGHFREALAIDEADGNLYGIASDLTTLGEMELMMGQYPAAERDLTRALAVANEMKSALMLKEVYQRLPKLYHRMGADDKAYAAQVRYIGLSDSLYTTESTRQLNELHARFETDKKEQQNRIQALQLADQRLTIRKRNMQLGAALAGLLAAALIGWLLVIRDRLRSSVALAQERERQQQERTAAVIEAEERERRRIGADLHDSVGQLLTAVKLNLSGLEHELTPQLADHPRVLLDAAQSTLDESLREVRAISHQLVPNALIRQGLTAAVREFVQKISSAGGLTVRLDAIGLESRLPPVVEGVLYRVIQELVANVVRHSRADDVLLQLVHHGPELTVLLEDNGVGFDVKRALDSPESGIGLRNLYSRIEYLGGQLEIDSRPGRGTIVTIEVPITAWATVPVDLRAG